VHTTHVWTIGLLSLRSRRNGSFSWIVRFLRRKERFRCIYRYALEGGNYIFRRTEVGFGEIRDTEKSSEFFVASDRALQSQGSTRFQNLANHWCFSFCYLSTHQITVFISTCTAFSFVPYIWLPWAICRGALRTTKPLRCRVLRSFAFRS
jgi:hypothetical protein